VILSGEVQRNPPNYKSLQVKEKYTSLELLKQCLATPGFESLLTRHFHKSLTLNELQAFYFWWFPF
jgi:hypothetical protein